MVDVLAADPAAAALLLDFDGSLAPIVDDPAAAAAPASTLDLLERVAARLAVVGIVSGRPVDFLAAAVPVPGVELVGQYGLERRRGGHTEIAPGAERYVDAVARAAATAEQRWPDLIVERKGALAVTVHWRAREEDGDAIGRAVEAIGTDLGLEVHPTRMACELRPPIGVDKGTGVRALLDDAPDVARAAFAGDDRGDLAAFAALEARRGHGRLDAVVRIAVRSVEMPGELLEEADLVVDGPPGLAAWLTELADALR